MPRTKTTDFDEYKYQQEYIKKNLKFVNVPFNSKFPEEMDLYDHLNDHAQETGEKKGSYIKRLIREDMEKTEKRYMVNPEFFSLWGDEVDEDTIVTESEVRRLAREWDKTFDELKEQLILIDE